MAMFTEWSDALEDALAQPFPDDCIQRLREKGAAPYVTLHHYIRKLNHLVGHGWSMGTPVHLEVGGKLIFGLPITILGVTRINFGDEDAEAELNEEGKEKMFGTPCTNAFAQAFKRTCALFGMGLNLYDKSDPQRTGRRTAQQTPQTQPKAPAATKAPVPNGTVPATSGQVGMITKLSKSHVITQRERDDIAAKLIAGMSKEQAHRAIEWLKEQIGDRKAQEEARAEGAYA